MALNDVAFSLGQGGLGRQPAGTDFYSGMIFWVANGSLPSGYSTTDRIKIVRQIEDAEALGILDDYSDETKAIGSYLVTNKGAAGDIIVIKITEPDPNATTKLVTLCTYTALAGDSTVTLLGASIAAAINAGTATHGYTASAATGTVSITARPGLGIFLNTGSPITATITGTIAGTITQFSAGTVGVASKQAVWHYHINRFFQAQANAQGQLYLMFAATPGGAYDFAEITTLQTFANGLIKQVGTYLDSTAFTTTHLNTIQSICNTLDTNHLQLSVIHQGDISGTADLSTLTDLGLLTDKNLTNCIGQDGAALGWALFKATGKSIGTMGTTLGTTAAANVAQSIAWVAAFNVSDGTEYDTVAFANGQLYRSLSSTLIAALDTYRYVFLRKFTGTTVTTGTYHNGAYTCIASTSDYATIQNQRTIDKAKRVLRDALLPYLNSPIKLNSDGTISNNDVANYQTVGGSPLEQMKRNLELSEYKVTVNPAQNILSTGTLAITVQIIPYGTATNIVVTIGYTQQITQ
jgi:hypothetical protein